MKRRWLDWGWDPWLLGAYLALVLLGVAFMYSASPDYAMLWGLEPLTLFRRHVLFALLGVGLALVVGSLDYRWAARWAKVIPVVLLFTLLGLLFLRLVGGSLRFLYESRVGRSVQPAELLKPLYVGYLALWLARRRERESLQQRENVQAFVILTALFALIAALEPDLSAAVTIALMGTVLALWAGMGLGRVLLFVMGGGLLGAGLAYLVYPPAIQRWQRYLAGLHDPAQAYEQVRYAMMALARGGWFGVGFGNAQVKVTGLPLPTNDTILAVIGEEWGLAGVMLVVGLFGLLFWRSMRLARQAPDLFGQLLAAGLGSWLVWELWLNLASLLNLAPVAGNSVPLVSLGGSNMVSASLAVGGLLSVSRVVARERAAQRRQQHAVVDLRGRHRRRRVPRPRRDPAPGE